jgi:RNA polymerase sigma-70 factor, ECF subfamily
MTTADDDRDLIDCILAGDPLAWEKCVRRFSDMVWRILRGPLRLSNDKAADAFQDIFLALQKDNFRRIRQWRGRAPLDAYMVVVVRRLVWDHLRAQPHEKGLDGDDADPVDSGPTPEEEALRAERQRAVQTCRERLAERDRELLDLRYALGLRYQAIAIRMNMTVSNVGVVLSRAEERIRRCLRERYPDLLGSSEAGVQAVV